LQSSGLYLSDLSMHDGSRFLAMQGTQRLSEIEFACDREKLKRGLLEETTLKLEEEKRRSEEILYSMMPREIAERMKNGDRELTTCEVTRIKAIQAQRDRRNPALRPQIIGASNCEFLKVSPPISVYQTPPNKLFFKKIQSSILLTP